MNDGLLTFPRSSVRAALSLLLACYALQRSGQSALAQVAPATFILAGSTQDTINHRETVVGADLDGDGKADLVLGNMDEQSVSVLIGNGGGSFKEPVTYQLGTKDYPVALVVADFNGDQKPDIAVATEVTIEILLGNGDGSFQSARPLPPVIADELAVGDVNHDGIVDLITTAGFIYPDTRDLAVLLGNGDGTFNRHYYAGEVNAINLVDVDHDGNLDIVSLEQEPNMGAYLGQMVRYGRGDGTFASPVLLSKSSQYFSIAADFGGDGRIDLVGEPLNALGTLQLLQNNGTGSFQPGPILVVDGSTLTATNTVSFGGAFKLKPADFNGDGRPDLAVELGRKAVGEWPRIAVLLNNGDGTFEGTLPITEAVARGPGPVQAPGLIVVDEPVPYGGTISIADFNGDGKPDLAVSSYDFDVQQSTISIYLNTTAWPAPAPRLSAVRADNTVVLSWAQSSIGFTLESSTTLEATDWHPINASPVLTNGNWQVSISLNEHVQSFRLKK